MTSNEVVMLNKDRVFFTRPDADVDAFSDDCCLDCFLKTILSRIREGDIRAQTLVLVSTRELASQITETMRKIAEPMSVRVHACVEGTSVTVDKMVLVNGVHIIVGTPNRVKQMITLKSLLLDAADLFIMYDFCPLLSKDMREAAALSTHGCMEPWIVKISVVVNYEMPRKVRGYVRRVAPMDLEGERTVVNLIKNKREADLMETVQSQYGISIEHYMNPHCILF